MSRGRRRRRRSRPWRACSRRTAASVSGPKSPSVSRWSAACRREISLPPEASPPCWPSVSAIGRRRARVMILRGDRRGWRRQRFLAADAERAPCRRSDDAVDGHAVAGLQATHGSLGCGTEVAVGRAGAARTAGVRRRCHRLHLRSMKSTASLRTPTRRGDGARAGTHRGARFRSDDAVDGQPVRGLEGAHGGFGLGP